MGAEWSGAPSLYFPARRTVVLAPVTKRTKPHGPKSWYTYTGIIEICDTNRRASWPHSRASANNDHSSCMTDVRVICALLYWSIHQDIKRLECSEKGCPEHKVACNFPRRSVVHRVRVWQGENHGSTVTGPTSMGPHFGITRNSWPVLEVPVCILSTLRRNKET